MSRFDIGENLGVVINTVAICITVATILTGMANCAEQESRERMARYATEEGEG
jgi:hypothetical protein